MIVDPTSPTGLSLNGKPVGSLSSNGLYWRTQTGARYRIPGGRMVNVGTYSDPYEAHLAALAHRLERLWL